MAATIKGLKYETIDEEKVRFTSISLTVSSFCDMKMSCPNSIKAHAIGILHNALVDFMLSETEISDK